MVVDDYARIGLTIERDQARDRRAAALGVRAVITFDTTAEALRVELAGDVPAAGGPLLLTLSHPTRAERDLRIAMAGENGVYDAPLALAENSRWYVQLEPADGAWRLAGELTPGAHTLRIEAARAP
jgi:hypothetical protein